ncbi:MAG: glycosyl hydrolase [Aestuariibacter sp.]
MKIKTTVLLGLCLSAVYAEAQNYRKGIGYPKTDIPVEHTELGNWSYAWWIDHPQSTPLNNFEIVPMLAHSPHDNPSLEEMQANETDYATVYNECHHYPPQCAVSAYFAVDHYEGLERDFLSVKPKGKLIVGGGQANELIPRSNYDIIGGLPWMRDFVELYRLRKEKDVPRAGWHFHVYPHESRINANPNYKAQFEHFVLELEAVKGWIEKYGTLNDEVWITEIGCLHNHCPNDISGLANQLGDYFDGAGQWVDRYAWYAAYEAQEEIGVMPFHLVNKYTGEFTPLGNTYAAITPSNVKKAKLEELVYFKRAINTIGYYKNNILKNWQAPSYSYIRYEAQSTFLHNNKLEFSLFYTDPSGTQQAIHRIYNVANETVDWSNHQEIGPFPVQNLPGPGKVSAQSTFVYNNNVEQTLWLAHNNQAYGYHRKIPILPSGNVDWDNPSTWSGPSRPADAGLPNNSPILAKSAYMFGSYAKFSVWQRDNDGIVQEYVRTIPFDSAQGEFDWDIAIWPEGKTFVKSTNNPLPRNEVISAYSAFVHQ